MSRPIAPLDPRARALLATAGVGDLFNPRQHDACELVEQLVREHVLALLAALDLALDRPQTVADLLAPRGLVPAFAPALGWLLDYAATTGLLEVADGRRYRAPAPLPPAQPDQLAAELLATEPSYAPTIALLAETAAIYPRLARGETNAERALFQKVGLWAAYFDDANGYYALTNRVAARVAARRLRDGGAVLEVGAGLGSATGTLLAELGERAPSDHLATEPVPFFRRRAQRTLAARFPGVPLRFADLDIDRPWAAQGIAARSRDLVWGVNVFHVARDLDVTLAEARAALAPGGWLVIGEGIRPVPHRPVGAEFPFQLLAGFADVALDPERRPTPGFLTAEHWLAALTRAGFGEVETVPDVLALRPFYPGLLAAAVCGRRS